MNYQKELRNKVKTILHSRFDPISDLVYEETKNMDRKEVVDYFRKGVDRILDEMGYRRIEMSNGVYRLNRRD